MSLEISGVSSATQKNAASVSYSEQSSSIDGEIQKEINKTAPKKLSREELLNRRAYFETKYDVKGLKGHEDEIYQRIVDENGKETLIYQTASLDGFDYNKVEIEKSHAYTIIRAGAPLCDSPEKALKSENKGFVVYIDNFTGRIAKINNLGDLYDFRFVDLEPDPSIQYNEWKF